MCVGGREVCKGVCGDCRGRMGSHDAELEPLPNLSKILATALLVMDLCSIKYRPSVLQFSISGAYADF